VQEGRRSRAGGEGQTCDDEANGQWVPCSLETIAVHGLKSRDWRSAGAGVAATCFFSEQVLQPGPTLEDPAEQLISPALQRLLMGTDRR